MARVRYMGTKRALAPIVRDAITTCTAYGRVADLFSGMCSIASEMSCYRSVFLSDVMAFPTTFARAYCLQGTRRTPRTLLPQIFPLFDQHRRRLRQEFADRLHEEELAIANGPDALRAWMESAPHVGNSHSYRRMAESSRNVGTCARYRLATLYFSAAYFSTNQAIDLDALRFACDNLGVSRPTGTPLRAVWLATASRVINSPGHSAQFLKPSPRSFFRLRQRLATSVWQVFADLAHVFSPWGTRSWRAENSVVQANALEIIPNGIPHDVGVVYADPPYTRDHYSRFYHLFETLLLYDFPESIGSGRYRGDRYASPFSQKTLVAGAFEDLFVGVKRLGIPLVLSYPSDGMLNAAGVDVGTLVRDHFPTTTVVRVPTAHSTMGASKGAARKNTVEQVFTCQ